MSLAKISSGEMVRVPEEDDYGSLERCGIRRRGLIIQSWRVPILLPSFTVTVLFSLRGEIGEKCMVGGEEERC